LFNVSLTFIFKSIRVFTHKRIFVLVGSEKGQTHQTVYVTSTSGPWRCLRPILLHRLISDCAYWNHQPTTTASGTRKSYCCSEKRAMLL